MNDVVGDSSRILSAMANGTSQPATESLVATLKGTVRDTGLDLNKMSEAAAHFRKVAQRLKDTGALDPKVLNVDTNTLLYQVPGGMLSNLVSQLDQAGALDRLDEVLAETPLVRKDLGYPPLVTPMSQMVGVQAVSNVLMGKYKNIGKEVQAYIRGEYGRAPGEIDPALIQRVLGNEKPMEGRYADTLEPIFEKTRAELGPKARSEEDVLSYISFPQVAEKFFAAREEKEANRAAYRVEAM